MLDRGGGRERAKPTDALRKWLQWQGLGQDQARSLFQFPHMDAGVQSHWSSLSALWWPQQQEAGLETEQPGIELVAIWDAAITSIGLSCYVVTQTPILNFQRGEYSPFLFRAIIDDIVFYSCHFPMFLLLVLSPLYTFTEVFLSSHSFMILITFFSSSG